MLKELLAVLLLDESNFKIMHWQCVGNEFDNYHKNITSNYYEMCNDLADQIAEMEIRLGGQPLNYQEVLNVIDASDKEHLILSSDKYYTKEEIVHNTDILFEMILTLIEEALQQDNIANNIRHVGIKSSLEAIHDKIDLEYSYLNKRKL